MYNQKIDVYLEGLKANFDSVEAGRKTQLNQLSELVKSGLNDWKQTNVIFICTHNSRRSQIAELFFRISLRYYKIDNLHGYSGGTEATAFNPSAVDACKEKGASLVKKHGSIANHTYMTTYKYHKDVIKQFSKKYDDPHNPTTSLIAVMVCDHAAEACPMISGVATRFNLQYKDPKYADGTAEETKVYSHKVDEIALEMLYLCHKIAE